MSDTEGASGDTTTPADEAAAYIARKPGDVPTMVPDLTKKLPAGPSSLGPRFSLIPDEGRMHMKAIARTAGRAVGSVR